LAEAWCCAAIIGIAIVRIEGKLRRIAQLKGVKTSLQ
jgi:hypothetical protein